jgi:phosphoglycerol transferase MdoB-like AlkP superfamily enzyme
LRFKPDHGKPFQKRNVVLIIVESLSRNHLGFISGRSNTPFLDSLLAQSLYFDRAFANARVSIEGVPAIIASIPSWQDNPFIFSPYSTNRIQSFATLLKPHGYKTSFFHGGSAGTMGFNYFCALAGIESYYGREEYPLETDYDGSWGIWDEPFLQFMASELDHTAQPFATAVFTLNPHDPFRIPKHYTEKFRQAGHPIETSIRYTDHALEQFFNRARKSQWYKNTLFIITADHTAPITEDKRFPSVDEYRIPIAFFLPDSSLRGSSDQIAEQIDILPSILDLLGYPDSCFNFGKSLFRNDCSRSSVNYRNGLFQYIDSDYCYQFNGKSAVALYQWPKDSFFTNNLIWNGQNEKLRMEKDKALKKRLQRFNQALIRNQMH